MIIQSVFIAYVIAMLLIGIYEYRKTRGLLDYYLAGKNLGALVVSFSFFATYFSTAAFLGGGGFGFVLGFQWSALLSFFHILFAILAWVVVAMPMKEITDKYGPLTVSELFRFKFGRATQVVSASIILIFFEFYMISIYKGGGNILQIMMNIDYRTGLLITALVVAIYTAIGGFRAVVMTDLIQGIIVLVGGIALFLGLIYSLGGFNSAIESLANTKIFGGLDGEALFEFGKLAPPPIMKAGMVIPFVLSLTFAISVAQLASPQLVIRFVAARDKKVIAHGMVLTPLIIGIFALCVFSLGPFGWLIIPKYADVTQFLEDPDLVVPFMAMKLFPIGLNALILTAVIAAAMSTINSLVHIASTSFVRDLIQNIFKIDDSKALKLTRFTVILFALIPFALALNPPGYIVEIVGLSFSVITSAFLVPLIFALYSENCRDLPAVASMISAVIACAIWYFTFYKVYWVYPVIPGLIASAVTYLLVDRLK